MSKITLCLEKSLQGAQGNFRLQIDTHIESGALIALFGKSGVGKTSILRLLSGLDSVENGYIRVDDEIWLDTKHKISLATQKRNVGFVFQHYALFPHLNVFDNICFGLRNKNDKSFAFELLERMNLVALAKARIWNLSGGQQQRVALARALVRRPKILLLDEPFSALDNAMRITLQNELHEIHKNFALTTLLVSHNISEIFALASHVFHIEDGHIISQGTPMQVFCNSCDNPQHQIQIIGEIIQVVHMPTYTQLTLLYNGTLLSFTQPPHTKIPPIGSQILLHSSLDNPQITPLHLNS